MKPPTRQHLGIGWVYVATHVNSKGLTKIGITRNPPNRRHQLGGDDLTVLAMLFSWNPEITEKRLQDKFDAVRVPQSEWFNLTAGQVQDVITELQSQHALVMAHVVSPQPVAWPLNPEIEVENWMPEEPKWCTRSNAWRYVNRAGDACVASSLQEAINNS